MREVAALEASRALTAVAIVGQDDGEISLEAAPTPPGGMIEAGILGAGMTAVAATVAYPLDGIGVEAAVAVEVKRSLEEVAEGTVLPGSLSRPRSFTCVTLATQSFR